MSNKKLMKKIIVIVLFSILILIPVSIVIKQESGRNSMQDEKIIQSVGNSIEGTYSVSVSGKLLGKLVLRQDTYSFSLTTDSSDKKVNNFFYAHPEGTYTKKYYETVTENSILENLSNNEILLQIDFLSSDGVYESYLIRNDNVHQEIYFHSIKNELELWEIRKSWDA